MHQTSGDDEQIDNKTILINETHALHKEIHEDIKYFLVNSDVRESSNPVEKLNRDIINKSLFSFSFVRHPYTR